MRRFELRVQEAMRLKSYDKMSRDEKIKKHKVMAGVSAGLTGVNAGLTGVSIRQAKRLGRAGRVGLGKFAVSNAKLGAVGAGLGAAATAGNLFMAHKLKKRKKVKESAATGSTIQEAKADKKASVARQINKIKGRVKGEASDFSKLSGKLAAKGAKTPGALAAFIGRKKFGAKGFAKLGRTGKAKAKAVKESRTIRVIPQKDTKGVSEKLGSMASTKLGRQEFAAKLAKKASKKARFRNRLMASLKGKI